MARGNAHHGGTNASGSPRMNKADPLIYYILGNSYSELCNFDVLCFRTTTQQLDSYTELKASLES